MGSIPLKTWIWFITLWSHAHSRAASYNTMILELLVDVPIRVCSQDFYEMVIPPCKNTKPV
jgi:hypothetical protein